MKYLLTISYDGSRYEGYQVQGDRPTVAKTLQDAVEAALGKRYPLTGCSRTDSGVHARDFKATVELDDPAPVIPPEKLPRVLNLRLPSDIAVQSAEEVSEDFHPRYGVKWKEYEYLILNRPERDPFYAGRSWFYPRSLDLAAMKRAAGDFFGVHDFSSFMAAGSKITDPVREIYACTVTEREGILSLRVAGNGFLYNMVRIMTGTLTEIGRGQRAADSIPGILAAKDRGAAGLTAPPEGLYLNRVSYTPYMKGKEA